MRGGRHLRPLRVHQAVSQMLETGRLEKEPPWYRVVGKIPPTTTLVRPPLVQFHEKKPRKPQRKPPGMFKPQRIQYPEDELRAQFFQDHPWELARPRILVENDGKDHSRHDWSKMRQRGKQLDGESVVQRQVWLMENENMTKIQAYDIARKEFYDLRMQEDIERRIASEEALAVGAKFGKSYMELGIQLEQEVLEDWKQKALAAAAIRVSRRTAFSGQIEEDEETAAVPGLEEGELETVEEEAAEPVAVAGSL